MLETFKQELNPKIFAVELDEMNISQSLTKKDHPEGIN